MMTGIPKTSRNGYNRALTSADGGPSLAVYMLHDHNENLDNLDINTAKCNPDAAIGPDEHDDELDGYSIGSEWVIKSLGQIYKCIDATAGAAVWALVFPSAALDFSQVLPEMGDIPWWNGVAISPLHHGLLGDMCQSGGHGAGPTFSDFPRTGWSPLADTLVYSVAANPLFTFTVTGDMTTTYTTGAKIKLTQGGVVRYFKILRSYCFVLSGQGPGGADITNTYVVVDGGSAQVLVNSTITLPFISRANLPSGFPIELEKEGWTGINESVAYFSWDATIFTGVIVAASADLTDRIRLGSRLRWTQANTVRYGIVTKIVYSGGNTNITVYGGQDYVLANSAMTGFSWSNERNPAGFPMNAVRWEFPFYSAVNRIQASPVKDQVYNLGGESHDLPPGLWKVRMDYIDYEARSNSASTSVYVWLDTQANGSGTNIIGSEGAEALTYCYGMIWGTAGGNCLFTEKQTVYFCMCTRTANQTSITSWTRYFALECQYL